MHLYLAQYSKLHISWHRPSVYLKDIVGAIPIIYDNLFLINSLNMQCTLWGPKHLGPHVVYVVGYPHG